MLIRSLPISEIPRQSRECSGISELFEVASNMFGRFETSGTAGQSGTAKMFGTSGTPGTSGMSGTHGTSGTSGTSGTFGTFGTSGTSGTPGRPGTLGTRRDAPDGRNARDVRDVWDVRGWSAAPCGGILSDWVPSRGVKNFWEGDSGLPLSPANPQPEKFLGSGRGSWEDLGIPECDCAILVR